MLLQNETSDLCNTDTNCSALCFTSPSLSASRPKLLHLLNWTQTVSVRPTGIKMHFPANLKIKPQSDQLPAYGSFKERRNIWEDWWTSRGFEVPSRCVPVFPSSYGNTWPSERRLRMKQIRAALNTPCISRLLRESSKPNIYSWCHCARGLQVIQEVMFGTGNLLTPTPGNGHLAAGESNGVSFHEHWTWIDRAEPARGSWVPFFHVWHKNKVPSSCCQ